MKKKLVIVFLFLFILMSNYAEKISSITLEGHIEELTSEIMLENSGFEFGVLPALGLKYNYFPSYNSFMGFSFHSLVLGLSLVPLDLVSTFDFAINFRFYRDLYWNEVASSINELVTDHVPFKDFIKDSCYISLGFFSNLYLINCGFNCGPFVEVGILRSSLELYDTYPFIQKYSSNFFSLRFSYGMIYNNSYTNFEYENSKGFIISLILSSPFSFTKDTKKDIDLRNNFIDEYKKNLLEKFSNEDVYSSYYKYFSTTSSILEGVPVTLHNYCRTSANGDWNELLNPFVREISFKSYILGDGKPGTIDYLDYKEVERRIPYYTESDKNFAREEIIKANNIKAEQKQRIMENKEINKNSLIYAFYPEINMSSLSYFNYDVEFEVGQIYDVCGLKSAKVINIMNNGDYNVVVNNYQFIMRNKSGEYIRDYLSTESALLRYIGEIEVVSSGGYVHYRPHFELLVKDRSPKLKNILKECETW